VLNALEDLPCPVIARVDGYALGGGLELALAADLIYAADSGRLGLSEAKLGFIPGWGGCRRLAERIGFSRAKQLFFVGQAIDASEALQIGLVDHVCPAVVLDEAIRSYVEQLCECSANAIAAFKRILHETQDADRARNLAAEMEHSVACVRDPDTQQRLQDFFASRAKP
jgi:enoyl-CoA hydratase